MKFNAPKNKKLFVNENKELEYKLARVLADYDNLRKRIEREKETWIRYSSERILIKLFSILDMFESAQDHLRDQGLAIAILEFRRILYEEGVEEVRPKKDDKFDANLHEVIETIDNGSKGLISELVSSGWKYKDGRIIRYAKVKVYGGNQVSKEEKKELNKEEKVDNN